MSVIAMAGIKTYNRPKITKIYARIAETNITGLVFEYADETRTLLVGPAADSVNVNPLAIIANVCENIPGVTEFGIKYCNDQKASDVQIVNTPDGFDRLEWGYYGDPSKYGYSLTDLNFYKNGALLGSLINKLQRKGSSRKDFVLERGHIANGLKATIYLYGDYWPYNFIDEIYGMRDPEVEWSACSCLTKTQTCTGKCFAASAACEPVGCAPPPIDGKWSDWSDWSECILTDGVMMQEQKRLCSPPQFGGIQCVGASSQFRKCISSQSTLSPTLSEPTSQPTLSEPTSQPTLSPTYLSTLSEPTSQSVVVSTESVSYKWPFLLMMLFLVLIVITGIYMVASVKSIPVGV